MARLLPGVWELFGAGVHVANHSPQFSKAANKVPTLDLRQLNPGHTGARFPDDVGYMAVRSLTRLAGPSRQWNPVRLGRVVKRAWPCARPHR